MANNFAIPAKFSGCEISSPEICRTRSLKHAAVFSVDMICKAVGFDAARCDEFVFCRFADGGPEAAAGVYAVENKKNAANHTPEEISGQLQGGAEILEQNMPPSGFGFAPVLASEKRILDVRRRALRNWKIKIRGQATVIQYRTAEKRYLSELKLSKIPPR